MLLIHRKYGITRLGLAFQIFDKKMKLLMHQNYQKRLVGGEGTLFTPCIR